MAVPDVERAESTGAPVAGPAGPTAVLPGARPLPGMQGRTRLRWLFAGVWMVYLVPLLQAAARRPEPSHRVVGLLAVVGFMALYLYAFALVGRLRRRGTSPSRRWRAVVFAGHLALCAVAALTVGQRALTMFVFIAVQAIFVLSRRLGLVVAATLIGVEQLLTHVVPGWEPDDQLWLSIGLATVAMWGVSGMIERNVELARAQETIAHMAVQNERMRFARDLHDVLGHALTVLTVKAELAGRLVSIDPSRAEAEIGEVERLAREALADVRAAVSGYREATLPGELASARAALDAAGITAELPVAVDAVPPERQELLAWAVREGVTNAVRHSAARHVWVRLDADGVEVADDGRGPGDEGAAGASHGNGLAGLRERASAAGASVTVRRREGGGFVLRVGW